MTQMPATEVFLVQKSLHADGLEAWGAVGAPLAQYNLPHMLSLTGSLSKPRLVLLLGDTEEANTMEKMSSSLASKGSRDRW